ncbi:uncharacterized protein LOC135219649 [Macrobrachium nipponense]|uniref:uncharacterized protein LOC135219649 n=1 Tax=Macrobrachium nipponense TaxID=159736 RepID=UPI0030C7F5CF
MASLKMFLCSPILIVVIGILQEAQVVSGYHDPYEEVLWVRHDRQSNEIEQVDERYIEYAEDLEEGEEEGSFPSRYKRNVVEAEEEGEEEKGEGEWEDDAPTEEDIEDLVLARKELDDIQRQILARLVLNATINGTTIVNLNNSYCFQSHDTFGITRYPNKFRRVWCFTLGGGVYGLELKCSVFRVEFARCCQYDKFITFVKPYTVGVRHCGRIDCLKKFYYRDLKIIWKTDSSVRKAGFSCKVTPIPCCGAAVRNPPVKKLVTKCADLRPGYHQCDCTDMGPGKICLRCSICETCDMEFFAVHNFSSVSIYLYMEFPCPNCTMNFAAVSYGFEQYVKGHVTCLNPYPNVVLRPYPFSEIIIALFCPVDPNFFNICQIFSALIAQGKRSPVFADGDLPYESRVTPGSLVILVNQGNAPGTPHPPVNLNTLSHPETVISLTINDSQCDFFYQSQNLNLTVFTQVEEIDLYLCNVTLPCGSIIINSINITEITIRLPDPSNCNPGCVVSNQAPPVVPPPVVNCLASN